MWNPSEEELAAAVARWLRRRLRGVRGDGTGDLAIAQSPLPAGPVGHVIEEAVGEGRSTRSQSLGPAAIVFAADP